jgi:hypothetical protein
MSSSNQVYNNSVLPSPNVYISQLLQPGPGGGVTTPALTLTGAAPQITIVQPAGAAAVGSGQYLTLNSTTGQVEVANPYVGQSIGITEQYLSTDAAVSDSAITPATFDVLLTADPALTYAAGTFTVVRTAKYQIAYSLCFAAGAPGGVRWGWIEFASTGTQRWGSASSSSEDPFVASICGTATRVLVAGDTFAIQAFQSNPGFAPINLLGLATDGADACSITVLRLIG